MATRFVILHHITADGEHWDLMLERGGVLMTWQLPRNPSEGDCLPLAARRIRDHRKAYLDYEGIVSGNRGHVKRVDQGLLEPKAISEDLLIFRLSGSLLVGEFRLDRDDDGWTLRRAEPGST